MSGVSWRHRKEGDWLASNGRWYPARSYPRGWSATALPPAPGHGPSRGVSDLVSSAASRVQDLAGLGSDDPPGPFSVGSSTTTESGDGSSASASGVDDPFATKIKNPYVRPPAPPRPNHKRPRQPPAEATVTSQRTHVQRVGPGDPPAKGLPPAPGRVSADAPDLGDPPAATGRESGPPPPTGGSAGPVRPPMPGVGQERSEMSGGELLAGDLGRVFGSAKKRIERALEDTE